MLVEIDSDTEIPHFYTDKSLHVVTDESTAEDDNIHIYINSVGMRIEVFAKDSETRDEPVFEEEMSHEQWVQWFRERAGTA